MDKLDELVIQAILKDEANATVDEDVYLKIISCLLCLQVELCAALKCGGSTLGERRRRKGRGWKSIAYSISTILLMSQPIP
jgi:hypothetical protein